MADKEYIFEKIERYLQGEMSPEERAGFEQELRKNSELQKKYELHVAANELLLERRLQKVRAKTKAHSNKKVSSGKTLLYATAFLVTLALLTTVFFFTTSSNSDKKSVLATDSITINTSKNKDNKLRSVIVKQDSSAYDTLVKSVKKKDKTPTSHVDVIYKKIQEEEKKKEIQTSTQDSSSTKKASSNPVYSNSVTKEQNTSRLKKDTVISCEDYVLHFDVTPNNVCVGKENGSIKIEVENSSTAPYEYHIYNEFSERVSQNGLSSGSYTIYISDKNGCKSSSLGFYIEEKFCLEDYLINSTYNEVLRLPKNKNKFTFKVYDKSGQLYYSQNVEEYEALEWNGINLLGQIIPGYYLIRVEIDGKIKKGSVTIKN